MRTWTTNGPDLRALTEPIDPGALQAYRSELKRVRDARHLEARSDRLGRNLWRTLLIIVAAVVIVAIIIISDRRAKRVAEARLYRLLGFARANGLTYAPERSEPLPGLVFGTGRDRSTTDILTSESDRRIEFGNHSYTVGSGRHERTQVWGYVAIRLRTALPHIVLDATSNNGKHGAHLPTSFRRAQRLSVGGEFDRHFALYVPQGYEMDAHYIFSPDVMAQFIDTVARLDVEIVDDWMFLYLPSAQASSLDANRWAWLMHVARTMQRKMDRWERWRDDRLRPDRRDEGAGGRQDGSFAMMGEGPMRPPPGVDDEGQRLKQGLPVRSIVAAVLVVGGLIAVAMML